MRRMMRTAALALTYAPRGWRVLPLHAMHRTRCSCGQPTCDSPAKHPRLASWTSQASRDAQTIVRWWRTWPEANVGVATGAGLLVLDVDPRHAGDASLADLERANG